MKKFSLNEILIGILAALLVINGVALAAYTITTRGKLAEAINLAKPQVGSLTLINADDCTKCRPLDALQKFVSGQNVEFTAEKTLASSDSEAKKIIADYGIQKLPALIFESEEKIKTPLKKALEKGSRSVGETALVWEQTAAPYFDVKTGETFGLVTATFITDKSCAECYDPVGVHKNILNKFGVTVAEEQTVDAADAHGAELVKKYNVTALPTLVLSKEADAYPGLKVVWEQVGTIEKDGTFVFRQMDVIRQPYRDLKAGKVVKPKD